MDMEAKKKRGRPFVVGEDVMGRNVRIRKHGVYRSVQVVLPIPVVRECGLREVVFDWRNMVVRPATIMDKKTYKIGSNSFMGRFPEELVGDYDYEINGDEVMLFKKDEYGEEEG